MKAILWNGKRIEQPCIIKDMPINIYHSQCCAGASVSSTNLRRVLEVNKGSPAHMFHEWSGNPKSEEREDKRHFIIGRAVHHWLLGQKEFSKHFVVRPSKWQDWRTTASREWRDEVNAKGQAALTEEDMIKIAGMGRALGRDHLVRGGLLAGQIERSFFWQDKATGLWCKSRPDAVPTDSGDFADLKGTTSVQYDDLARSMRQFGYHQQAALVEEGARICGGIVMSSFTFVFVEFEKPHCVRLVHLKGESLKRGHEQNNLARQIIAGCIKSGRWPGPGEGHIASIDVGEYYHDHAEREAEQFKVDHSI